MYYSNLPENFLVTVWTLLSRRKRTAPMLLARTAAWSTDPPPSSPTPALMSPRLLMSSVIMARLASAVAEPAARCSGVASCRRSQRVASAPLDSNSRAHSRAPAVYIRVTITSSLNYLNGGRIGQGTGM
jgi:hypothetical protein